MINAQELAEAVAHWLRFEDLCRRRVLFTERHMSHAIGQYLIANHGNVVPEVPHPVLGNLKIDFGVKDGETLSDVIETKLITERRTTFSQEIFHDVCRLELASTLVPNAWLLVAGLGKDIIRDVVREIEEGESNPPLQGILSEYTQAAYQTVDVFNSAGESREYWKNWYDKVGRQGVRSLTTQLVGRWIFDDAIGEEIWMCFVWKVRRSDAREEFEW